MSARLTDKLKGWSDKLSYPGASPRAEATSAQVLAVQLQSYFHPTPISYQYAIYILEQTDWNLNKATRLAKHLLAAEKGLMLPVPDQKTFIINPWNSEGTSCYIGSLLFALFATNSFLDPTLFPISESRLSTQSKRLQTELRKYVNALRGGNFIASHLTESLRYALQKSGWHASSFTQEDVSELYIFIADQLNIPQLSLRSQLIHEGQFQNEDDKIIKERVLQLALESSDKDPLAFSSLSSLNMPFWKKKGVDIGGLLREYFFGGKVPNLRRMVPDEHGVCKEKQVTALTQLRFITLGDMEGLVVPITLKRYSLTRFGNRVSRNNQRIRIPEIIPANEFVINAEESTFVLQLQSIVCHRGSTTSGHYVAYSRAPTPTATTTNRLIRQDLWLRMNDKEGGQPVKFMDWKEVCREAEHNGYFAIYVLLKLVHPEDLRMLNEYRASTVTFGNMVMWHLGFD